MEIVISGRKDDSENSRAFVDKRQEFFASAELCLRIKGTTDKVKNNMLVRRKKIEKAGGERDQMKKRGKTRWGSAVFSRDFPRESRIGNVTNFV